MLSFGLVLCSCLDVAQERAERDLTVGHAELEGSRVALQGTRDNGAQFEVESLQGSSARAEIARAVVESGWNLTELHAHGLSLEEVFLQLTSGDQQ